MLIVQEYDLVKVTILMTDIEIIGIINEIYGEWLKSDCLHARAAYEVSNLPARSFG